MNLIRCKYSINSVYYNTYFPIWQRFTSEFGNIILPDLAAIYFLIRQISFVIKKPHTLQPIVPIARLVTNLKMANYKSFVILKTEGGF
jgi:hypothetical protein